MLTYPAVWAVLTSRVLNGTAKAACLYTHFARTLDYGTCEALTTYGIIGVKVWIYKGDILEHDPMARDKRIENAQGGAPRN